MRFENVIDMVAFVVLILGLVNCFFGYKIFRILNAIKGFLVGGAIGSLIGLGLGGLVGVHLIGSAQSINELISEGAASIILGMIIGFLGGGILGALLANVLVVVIVFLQSFVVGVLAGAVLAVVAGAYNSIVTYAVLLGLLLAVASCILFKYMIIIQTALEGSIICGLALTFDILVARDVNEIFIIVPVICAIALCVAGIVVQQRMLKEDADNRPGAAQVQTVSKPAQVQETSDSIQTQPVCDSIQVQATSSVSTEPVGNYNEEPTGQKDEQKLLANLFQRDIYDEMRYVFPGVNVQKIRYYPVFNEDGGWVCSCGNENNGDTCIFCGMSKKDIQEKLNFAYLNEHMRQRRRKAEEERNRQKQENREKTAEIIKKVTTAQKRAAIKTLSLIRKAVGIFAIFVKKHRKKLLVIGIIVSCGIGGYEFFIHNSTCMMKYYLFRADREEDTAGKYQYYRMALNEQENLESYINMISIALDNGTIGEAVRLNDRAKALYADDSQYQELEQTLYPTEPYFVTEGGNYDRRITVEIAQSTSKYNQTIHYAVNSQSGQDYQAPIAMDTSGSYTVLAWTTNDFGYTSEQINSEYIVDIEIPDMVTASIEPGEYQSVQYVELSQSKGETIYYTTDGANPNQSAYVYNGPIECGFGVNRIKAICYSANGEPSDIMDYTYYVSYEDHNAWKGFSGYYYDYVCVGSDIRINDKKSGTTVNTIWNAGSPNEYHGKLYYVDYGDERNIKVYANGESSLVVPDANAVQMLIVHDSIYYFDVDLKLIRTDIDGTNKQLVYDNANTLTKSNGKLYFYSNPSYMCIDSRDAVPTEIPGILATTLLYVDESTYVYIMDGDLHVMHNGADTILVEQNEQRNIYYTGTLFRHKVEDSYIHDIWSLSLSNHSVVYICRDGSSHMEYSWANESILDILDARDTFSCMVYNIDTGETISLGEGEQLFMADDAYYIDGVRINMAH